MLEWLAYYWPTILVCTRAWRDRVRDYLLDGAQPQKGKDLLRL
jgi:hypothetical protein